MSILLMNLRHVPEDEAREVRELLDEHHIEFYETIPNRWGISAGGIWIKHPEQMDEARAIYQQYQQRRLARAKSEYREARRAGRVATFADVVRERPLQLLLAVGGIGLLLWLMLFPFLRL